MLDILKEIRNSDSIYLSKLLSSYPVSDDTFLASAAYILLTGRKGLWVSEMHNSYLLVCIHPNRDCEVLVFLPPGVLNIKLIDKVCNKLCKLNLVVKLSRIPDYMAEELNSIGRVTKITEEYLDWRYPVTVVDNEKVKKKAGKEFENLRNKINSLDTDAISRLDINRNNYIRYRRAAKHLIVKWSNSVAQQKRYSVDNLISPNLYAYDMAALALENFNVTLLLYKNEPIAVYTAEYPVLGDTINGITLSVARDVKGASEYAYWDTANSHHSAGYPFTSINGAETESLHQFRKKLNPSKYFTLHTYLYK